MNPHTKDLIFRDYVRSGKDLGSFALDNMSIYDDLCYELKLIDASGKHGKLLGSAIMDNLDKIYDLIALYEIRGEYKIMIVDAQKEFFCILAEIRDDLTREIDIKTSIR